MDGPQNVHDVANFIRCVSWIVPVIKHVQTALYLDINTAFFYFPNRALRDAADHDSKTVGTYFDAAAQDSSVTLDCV